jgi:hypothetical protein
MDIKAVLLEPRLCIDVVVSVYVRPAGIVEYAPPLRWRCGFDLRPDRCCGCVDSWSIRLTRHNSRRSSLGSVRATLYGSNFGGDTN